jgi:hypothetical protein
MASTQSITWVPKSTRFFVLTHDTKNKCLKISNIVSSGRSSLNLSIIGPNSTHRPESRPNLERGIRGSTDRSRERRETYAATIWNMGHIRDPQSTYIVSLNGSYPNLHRSLTGRLGLQRAGELTELRIWVEVTLVVLSTLRIAWPAGLTYASCWAYAACWSKYVTLPGILSRNERKSRFWRTKSQIIPLSIPCPKIISLSVVKESVALVFFEKVKRINTRSKG